MTVLKYILKNWEIGAKRLFTRPGAIIVEGFTLCLIAVLQIIFVTVLTIVIPAESKPELFLFLGSWQISNSLYGMLFAWSHDRLNNIIFDGGLDFLLLRPVSAFYSLSFGALDISNLFTIPIGVVLCVMGLDGLNITLQASSIFIFACLIVLGAIVIFLFYNALELSSIFSEGVMTFIPIAENLVEFGSHPVKKYTKFLKPLFPVITALNTAAEFTVEEGFTFSHMVPLLLTILVLTIINIVLWRLGLKHYSSASS